jgi:hypothetical protein
MADTPKIKFGSASAGPAGASVPQANEGFRTVEDGFRARRQAEAKALAGAPPVRPAVLIMACVAAVLMIVVIFTMMSKRGKKAEGLNPDAAFSDYKQYRVNHPGPPPADEELHRRLQSISLLENTGRKDEAMNEWKSLLLLSGGDPDSPLYQLSAKRLREGL